MKTESRRDFLKTSVAGLASTVLSKPLLAQQAGPIPQRDLGKTGLKVTMIGVGGSDIGMIPEKDAIDLVHRAVDLGVNFYDNAYAYHKGLSEEYLGKALKGERRAKVYVMTKSGEKTKEGALKQIDESLKRLQTDYLDLWQFHAVNTVAEVEKIWGPGGAMEGAQEALKAGKIRHIGLTGHKDPAVHARALDFEGLETLQFPVNPLDVHYLSFQKEVLPKAKKKGVGVIAMKTLSKGKALAAKVYTVEESLRYVWGVGVDVLVSGMQSIAQLEQNVGFAKAWTPMSEADREALLARCKPSAGNTVEYYKKKA